MIAEHQSLGLAVELSFYLALPLLAALVLGRPVEGASRLSRWRPALVLAGLVAVAVIWRTY